MEDNKDQIPQIPEENDKWLDELLQAPELEAEIGPDEQAIAAAGLTRPEDLELESIMQEAISENWGAEEADSPANDEALLSDEALLAYEIPGEEPEVIAEPAPAEEATAAQADEDFFSPDIFDEIMFSEAGGFKDDEFRNTFGEGEALSQIFESEAPAKEAAEAEAPEEPPVQEKPIVRKRRPKNKHSYGFLGIPHIIATLIWLVLVVAIGASLGRFVWVCAADVLAFGREDQAVYITITTDDTLDSVTEKLHAAGLVEYPGLFKLYGDLTDLIEEINPGTYLLNTTYDYHALSTAMSSTAQRVTVEVTIPEGYTCQQIFAMLEEKGVCKADKLEAYAIDGEIGEYWFLEGVTRGDKYCLEGYLFPDTYEFYLDDTPKRIFTKFLNAFDNRFTDIMKEKLETLNGTLAQMMKKHGYDQNYIDSHKMTIREVVIVASMIEKETSSVTESYTISSVIYNRLTNAASYPFLNIDATLVYALGKNELTTEDKLIDSPYNTYTHEGLIPGPISNPGRSSLDAALDPEDTKYYFYALDPEANAHRFFRTYQEHLDFLNSLKGSE